MKLAILQYPINSSRQSGKKFSFILLETTEDVLCYKAINEQIRSRQAVGFWIGFKSQRNQLYQLV